MSHPRKIHTLLWNTLTSSLCAGGLACVFLTAFIAQPLTMRTFVLCGVFALLFGVVDVYLRPRARLLAVGFYALIEGALFLMNRGLVHLMVQSARALYLDLSGVMGAAMPYAHGLCLLISLVFAFIAYFLMREDAFGFASACMLVLLCLGLFLTRGEGVAFALPVMASLIMTLSGLHGRRIAAIPVAVIIALGGYSLMPHEGTVYEPLEEAAQDVRDMTEDYFFFTETREAFSMYKAGFQPLKERLGGQANPSKEAVLEVYGPENAQLHLRAAAYNEYTGLNWYDTISSRRYLFDSRGYENLKTEVFDLARPMGDVQWDTERIAVRMLRGGATTLFVPQRIRTLTAGAQRMVPYFNTAGEIYITRNLRPDDSYQADYLPLNVQSARVRQLIDACAEIQDPRMTEVERLYLSVPDHIQQEVHDLADEITEGISDPLDKALAIRDYLKENYEYTLDVEDPPSSVDFVAYFLLAGREGYCTYFASAQTMLCRMAGVPARYVVGYVANTDGNGNAVVTGQDAHAWTEIYLNGFGWLTIDPTPGNQEGGEEEQDQQDGSDYESPPTPSPSPSPTPTPSPTPEAPEDNVTPTPTPAPEKEQDEPTSTPEPPNEEQEEEEKPPFPWLWLLLLLIILALLVLWFLLTDPDARAKRRPDRAGQIYLNACVTLLACMGMKRRRDETLMEFARRAQKQTSLEQLFDMAAASVYGKNKGVDARLSKATYEKLRAEAAAWAKCKARVRMLFGR